MRWLALLMVGLILGGIGFYVWDHNRALSEQAAANNGAVCTINVQLDAELFNIYQGGGLGKAFTGNMERVTEGNTTTSTTTVTTTLPELITNLQQDFADLSVVGGADCIPVVSKIPALQPGRVKVEIQYFRPTAALIP